MAITFMDLNAESYSERYRKLIISSQVLLSWWLISRLEQQVCQCPVITQSLIATYIVYYSYLSQLQQVAG